MGGGKITVKYKNISFTEGSYMSINYKNVTFSVIFSFYLEIVGNSCCNNVGMRIKRTFVI